MLKKHRQQGPALGIIVTSLMMAFLLGGCDQLGIGPKADAEKAVKDVLVDPYSARFSDLKVTPTGDVCGTVNSKNRMGAYVGKSQFVYDSIKNVYITEANGIDLADAIRNRWFNPSDTYEAQENTRLKNSCAAEENYLRNCTSLTKIEHGDSLIACSELAGSEPTDVATAYMWVPLPMPKAVQSNAIDFEKSMIKLQKKHPPPAWARGIEEKTLQRIIAAKTTQF